MNQLQSRENFPLSVVDFAVLSNILGKSLVRYDANATAIALQFCSVRMCLGIVGFRVGKFINAEISNKVFSNKYNQS